MFSALQARVGGAYPNFSGTARGFHASPVMLGGQKWLGRKGLYPPSRNPVLAPGVQPEWLVARENLVKRVAATKVSFEALKGALLYFLMFVVNRAR
jgi:hypothetical protein